jgi:hypothetical protein
MAQETIITWNPANWVTVLIMVALGFTVLAFASKAWKQRQAAQ